MKPRITYFLVILIFALTYAMAFAQPSVPEAETPPDAVSTPGAVEATAEAPKPAEGVTAAPVAPEGTSTETTPEETSAMDLAAKLYDAVKQKEWVLGALLLLLLVVQGLRWGATKIEFLGWFTGKLGGWVLNFVSATAAAIVAAQATDAALDFKIVAGAVVLALAAAGGVEFFKDFIVKKKTSTTEGETG